MRRSWMPAAIMAALIVGLASLGLAQDLPNYRGAEVREQVPFGHAAPQTVASVKSMPWRVSADQAAELMRQGYSRRIEPETGNEQWVKSLTHNEPLPHSKPSLSATVLFPRGGSGLGSCGSSQYLSGSS